MKRRNNMSKLEIERLTIILFYAEKHNLNIIAKLAKNRINKLNTK